ncbi:MAG: hydrogen gas-evolving membrane-bound hydrogenase subunit E [Halobacteriota archaeon]
MEPQLWIVVVAIALPFVAAAIVPLLSRVLGDDIGYVGALIAAISFVLVASQLRAEGTVAFQWIPSLDVAVRLTVDGWSVLFALLASGIGVLIFVYSTSYMRGEPDLTRFYIALLTFMGSILGVAFAADMLVLFLFWELTSVSSFLLIGYHSSEHSSRIAARMAMFVTVGGGVCLLVGLVLLSIAAEPVFGTQTFDIAAVLENRVAVRTALAEQGLFVPVLVLVTIAAAAKSAQVPLHFWLPNAMVAPTPVSAFLHSATMVTVGVYALGRLRPLFLGDEWTFLIATLGLVTMVVGALLAVRSGDIKELLAYSTMSHLGLMVAGFGFGTHYGAQAGTFHLLNHALFKAALFLVAGIVVHAVGTRRLDDLGGLRRDLPMTAGIAAVASLSMAGIPPFNGFYSKELLFEAAWVTAREGGGLAWLYPGAAVFGSVFTVLYSLRFLAIFVGDRNDRSTDIHRPPAGMVLPPAALIGVVGLVSLAPQLAVDTVVQEAAAVTAVEPIDVHVGIPREISGPVGMSIVTIFVGVAAYPFVDRVRDRIVSAEAAFAFLHPTVWYRHVLDGIDLASDRFGPGVHDGQIRTYVGWLLVASSGLTLAGYWATSTALPPVGGLQIPLEVVLVLGVAVIAAITVTIADSHVTGVLTLGILGFMVAIFYILSSAPDLALTQLVVETLLLLVFLLVLEELPPYYTETDVSVLPWDVAVSLLVGVTAFLSVLVVFPAPNAPLSDSARFYVDTAVGGAGGTNVVNVILTDFRAFDTLGESAVVVLAALSVLVLLRMRSRGEPR